MAKKNVCKSLSKEEKDQSFSSAKKQKKKKKTVKPVLASPCPTSLQSLQYGSSRVENALAKILPKACLGKSETNDEANRLRKSLALGVNAVNRHLGKDIAAVVVELNIMPQIIVSHIILKCIEYGVPLVKISKLRDITKKALDFECIAIGFRKNSEEFTEVIEAIRKSKEGDESVVEIVGDSVVEINNTNDEQVVASTTIADGDEDVPEEVSFQKPASECVTELRNFQYLKRADRTSRAFLPNGQPIPSTALPKHIPTNNDFISIADLSFVSDAELPQDVSSVTLARNQKSIKKKLTPKKRKFMTVIENPDEMVGVVETPPKKKKKTWKTDWGIDKARGPFRNQFKPANVMRIVSNENRKIARRGKTHKRTS